MMWLRWEILVDENPLSLDKRNEITDEREKKAVSFRPWFHSDHSATPLAAQQQPFEGEANFTENFHFLIN